MAVDGKPTFYHSSMKKDPRPWIIIDLAKEVMILKVVITLRPTEETFKAFAGVRVNIIIDLVKEMIIWKVVITIRQTEESFRGFAGVRVNIIIDLATITSIGNPKPSELMLKSR